MVHFSTFIKKTGCDRRIETLFRSRKHPRGVRIVVFGAGAMGSFFGGLLSRRHDVTLIGRADHVAAIRARGLRITGKTAMIARPHAATRLPAGAEPELIFLTTKSYDTAKAMSTLRPFADEALFVTVQNGLGNAEAIAKVAHRVVAGTTAHGVTYLGPGEIRHAGVGETVLGAWAGVREADLVRLRDLLADVGVVAQITGDAKTELWSKLVVNASINPLAALAGVPNGRLVRDNGLLACMEAVCREATSVAKAEGASVDPDELLHRTVLVARRTAANRGSMLQDLDRHRRTEIDSITGAVVRAAARDEIPVPLNRVLLALVRARESAGREASDANVPA